VIAQDESSVDELLDRLSGLPLALTQAAAYIGQTAVSISRYLEYYDRMWKDLMEHQHEYSLQEYTERSVLTTWRISYEQVKSQNEGASNLLQLWSYLHAGDLWYELVACSEKLVAWVKEFRIVTTVPDWLTVLAENELAFNGALRLLIKYSLVESKKETASYAMHSVLHSWCRYVGASEAERDSFQKLAVQLVGCMTPNMSAKECSILQRRLLPHGQAVFNGIMSKKEEKININETWAYMKLASMFADQDRYVAAEAMYERALAIRKKVHGSEHTSTLNTVKGLSKLYLEQGRLVEAEPMYERTLARTEKALGPTHTSTLATVNGLGVVYLKQGRLVEAEAMYKRALAGYEKALGPTHKSTLVTVNNLGYLYYKQGRLVEAEELIERALAGQEKTLGPTQTSTLNTVNNLGGLYLKQCRIPEAEAMFKRALAGYEKTLGSTHTSTVNIVNNLVNLYREQGRLTEAGEIMASTHDRELSEPETKVEQAEQATTTHLALVSGNS
jgi:tetratricopeptide (TPR) repeat protein